MRLRFIFSVSLKQLWNNLKSTLVIILSLTVCITSVFLMAEALLYSNNFLTDIELNRRTYEINMPGSTTDNKTSYRLYEEVVYGTKLPKISEIIGIYVNPVVSTDVEDYISAAVYKEEDSRYSVELDLIDGRSFSENEIAEGTNVIIIDNNLNYWREGNEYKVGDTVFINDISYEIIGIDNHQSYITEENVLKYENFYIYFDNIVFAEQLKASDEQIFMELFDVVDAVPESRFSRLFSEFAIHVLTYIVLIALVSYCAFSIIAQLFHYMVKSRRYEYNIYKVLGVRSSLLFALYFTPILFVSVISGTFGVLLYWYSEPLQSYIGMGDVLSPSICLICCLIIGIVLLIAVMPDYIRLKRLSATEGGSL